MVEITEAEQNKEKEYKVMIVKMIQNMDYIVHGVTKNWTRLSNFHFYWHISPWVYPISDSLAFLGLGGYFLSNVREVFSYNLFKYFLIRFLFLLLFQGPLLFECWCV